MSLEGLDNEDYKNLAEALEPLYRKAQTVVEKAEMVSPQSWEFTVPGDPVMELKDAVNAIALLVGEEQI